MQETMKVECKQCHVLKEKIMDGRFSNGKDKKWKSPEGKLWNGKVCPDCHKENVKSRHKKKKEEMTLVIPEGTV